VGAGVGEGCLYSEILKEVKIDLNDQYKYCTVQKMSAYGFLVFTKIALAKRIVSAKHIEQNWRFLFQFSPK
jgi:hypothetical protein